MTPTIIGFLSLVVAILLLAIRDAIHQRKATSLQFELLKEVDEKVAERAEARIRFIKQEVENAERKRLQDAAKYRDSSVNPEPPAAS